MPSLKTSPYMKPFHLNDEEEDYQQNQNIKTTGQLSEETKSTSLTSMVQPSSPDIKDHLKTHKEHHSSTSSALCAPLSPQEIMALIDQVLPHKNLPLIDIKDAFLYKDSSEKVHEPFHIPKHDRDNSYRPPTFCLSAPNSRDIPVEKAFVVEVKDTITSKSKPHNKRIPLGPLLRLFSGSSDKVSEIKTQGSSTHEPAIIPPSTPPGFPETTTSP